MSSRVNINQSLRIFENITEKEKRRLSDEIAEEERFISFLEDDSREKEDSIKKREEEINKLEHELSRINSRLEFARDQTRNLTRANEVLETNSTEKYKKLDILVVRVEQLRKQKDEILENYRQKWERYYKTYESGPYVRDYLKKKSVVMSMEEDLKKLDENKIEIEERIKNRVKESEKESIVLVVEIAKLKFDTNDMLTRMSQDERVSNKSKTPESRLSESRSKVPRLLVPEQTNTGTTPTPVVYNSPFAILENFRNIQFGSFSLKSKSKQTDCKEQTKDDSRKINAWSDIFDVNKFSTITTPSREKTRENKNQDSCQQLQSEHEQPEQIQQPRMLKPAEQQQTYQGALKQFAQRDERHQTQQGRDIEPFQFQRNANSHFNVTSSTTPQSFRMNFGDQPSFNFGPSIFNVDEASESPRDPPATPSQFFSFLPQDESPSAPNNNTTTTTAFKLFAPSN